jgi:diguanylate cyclase (GGDEF)-like protein
MSKTRTKLPVVAAAPSVIVASGKDGWHVLPSRLAVMIVVTFATFSAAAIETYLLVQLREAVWESAEREARNITRTTSDSIHRTFSMINLSLMEMKRNFESFDVFSLPPAIAEALLFGSVVELKDVGQSLILSEYGYLLFSNGARPPTGVNLADREYFVVHKNNASPGLFVGAPMTSRLSSQEGIALSRRLSDEDGKFKGVVVGFLRNTFFRDLFSHVDAPLNTELLLARTDGTVMYRWPADGGGAQATDMNVSMVPARLLTDPEHEGQFMSDSGPGEGPLFYVYHRLDSVPLVMAVALDPDVVLQQWKRQTVTLSIVTSAIIIMVIVLIISLYRALERRDLLTTQLNALTRKDPLTGLANRRYFVERLEEEWDDARRHKRPLSLLMIDVDHFKSVNDTYGHECGDELLRSIAATIGGCLKRPRELAVRFGGEEFVALLPETDAQQAVAVAEGIRSKVASTRVPESGGGSVSRTVSIGVSTEVPESAVMNPLIAKADELMYKAKASGRNTVCAG